MCPLPDHGRIIAVDRSNHIGVPGIESTYRPRPESAKVDHLVTRGSSVRKDARNALVAGAEFVELIARDRDEAPPLAEHSLTRAWARQGDNMERAISV